MRQADLERAVRAIAWPEPEAGLRARVLATPVTPQQIGWADRVWFSRAWRGAAVATAAAAIALAWLDTPPVRPPVPTAQALAAARSIEETGSAVGLPADLTASLVRRSLEIGIPASGGARRERVMSIEEAEGDRR